MKSNVFCRIFLSQVLKNKLWGWPWPKWGVIYYVWLKRNIKRNGEIIWKWGCLKGLSGSKKKWSWADHCNVVLIDFRWLEWYSSLIAQEIFGTDMDFSQVQSICQTSFKIHNVRIQGCNLAKLRIWSALFGETETKRSHEECQELLFWCCAMNSVINWWCHSTLQCDLFLEDS